MPIPCTIRIAFGGLLIGAAALAGAPPAAADELPPFRKGMWTFERTIDGGAGGRRQLSSRKCTEPAAEMRAQNARMAKAGCTFSSFARAGNQYTMSAQCTVMGISSKTRTVVTVESDSAYRITVDGETDGARTHETLVARRMGDC